MAIPLLKKSYQLSNLREVAFKDLWGSRGVFTTLRMIGNPPKLLLFKPHIENLIKSTKKYGIINKNLKNIIKNLIKTNTLYKGPDNLFRIALNKKLISVSIRKRPKINNNFNLLLFKYKRVEPNHKNLYYKKILAKLRKVDSTKFDIALVANDKILETGTSNLVFVKNGEFTILPKKIESSVNTANHQLLYQLSAQSGGKIFNSFDIELINQTLKNSERNKTILHSFENTNSILNNIWFLFFLIFLLSLEWIVRKYHGFY